MSAFEYALPNSVEEAVAILSSRSEARPVAGGQSMLLPRNRDRLKGLVLVDLRRLAPLNGISRQDGGVRIGAMASIAAIASNDLVGNEFPAFAEALRTIGDAQLRNRGTMGGNIAERDPEYDLPALLLALEASIEVAGAQGRRKVGAQDFFERRDRSSLKRDEVIVAISIPRMVGNSGMAYVRLKHPARLAAVCGVAAVVSVERGRISAAKIGLTGATDQPTRLEAVERSLLNVSATGEQVASGAVALDGRIAFRGDSFASAEYRGHLTRVFTERALKQALSKITT